LALLASLAVVIVECRLGARPLLSVGVTFCLICVICVICG
jgi:hypothetical protein